MHGFSRCIDFPCTTSTKGFCSLRVSHHKSRLGLQRARCSRICKHVAHYIKHTALQAAAASLTACVSAGAALLSLTAEGRTLQRMVTRFQTQPPVTLMHNMSAYHLLPSLAGVQPSLLLCCLAERPALRSVGRQQLLASKSSPAWLVRALSGAAKVAL